MTAFEQLEDMARKYSEKKHVEKKANQKINEEGVKLIDVLSSPDTEFPILRDNAVITSDVTTYVYCDNRTYPYLFEFIAEILHVKIPVVINDAKFGPGEIIINKDNQKDALIELDGSINELKKLIYAKKTDLV